MSWYLLTQLCLAIVCFLVMAIKGKCFLQIVSPAGGGGGSIVAFDVFLLLSSEKSLHGKLQ